jgi:hypothetical protein
VFAGERVAENGVIDFSLAAACDPLFQIPNEELRFAA